MRHESRARFQQIAACAIRMYNLRMKKTNEINFSEARQRLSTILDEVEKTGKAVTIVRRGKPAAVVISALQYRQKFIKQGEWKLAGSLKAVKGVDLEKAIQEQRAAHRKAWQESMASFAKELTED